MDGLFLESVDQGLKGGSFPESVDQGLIILVDQEF